MGRPFECRLNTRWYCGRHETAVLEFYVVLQKDMPKYLEVRCQGTRHICQIEGAQML